jgi:DNA-binding transcriptional ArsR family regulator
MLGDVDIAAVGALLADRTRCRILLALNNGQSMPASRLASEAGVAASTASEHLARLVDGGLVHVEQLGRHRYYRLAGHEVAELLEAAGRLAPAQPIRSLREGSRAAALCAARACYDHLAGRLGVALMAAFIDEGILTGGDGGFDPSHAVADRPASYGWDVDYRLTDKGERRLRELGVEPPRSRRPMVRYCVDWTEQRHHLSGALGAAVLSRLVALDWVRPQPTYRAVRLTVAGRDGLRDAFGIDCPDIPAVP